MVLLKLLVVRLFNMGLIPIMLHLLDLAVELQKQMVMPLAVEEAIMAVD